MTKFAIRILTFLGNSQVYQLIITNLLLHTELHLPKQ